jgi:hypothetical protein
MIICVRGATAPNSQWLLAAEFALDRGLSTLGVGSRSGAWIVSYQQDRPLRETWAASVPGSMKASRWWRESAMISRRSGKGARVLKALAGGGDVTSP